MFGRAEQGMVESEKFINPSSLVLLLGLLIEYTYSSSVVPVKVMRNA